MLLQILRSRSTMWHAHQRIAVLLLLVAGVTHAAQITTTIHGASAGAQIAKLRCKRIDRAAEPLEQSISVPGTAEIALGDGVWDVRIVGERLWAQPVFPRNEDSAVIPVWRTVALTGTAKGVETLRVGLRPLDADSATGEIGCSVEHESWTCGLPTGIYDLRFSSTGFAPEFRFGVTVAENPKPLLLHFVPGASLNGRVEVARGVRIPGEGVEVTLTSATGESAAWKQTARSDAKGFFQFKGLAPGDYSIHGHAKGLTTQSEQVKMLARAAAELNAPLLLDAPKRLTVTVMPPVDSSGNRWTVRLLSNNRRLRHSDVIAESRVSEAGEWIHTHLIAGDYFVQLVSSKGEYWKDQDVIVGQEDVTVAISALPSKVSGSVVLGDRPLKASLFFGGEFGPKLESDSSGRFAGPFLPDEREERTILVEAETPRVRRNVRTKIRRDESGDSHLEIRLPATTLMGRVLKQDRSPEPHAFLTVSDPEYRSHFDQVLVESDGSFQVAGIEPGTFRVMAEGDGGKKSREVAVTLREGEPSEPVELIIESTEPFRGRITMGEVPVIAADIYAYPRNVTFPLIPQAKTNEGGFFQVDLPPGTTVVDALVVHPAFDVVFGRTTLQRGKELRIITQQMGGTIILESKPANVLILLLHGAAEMGAQQLAGFVGGTIDAERITIPRLMPGQYSACTYDKTRCTSGYLTPHGTLTLTLN